MADYPKKTSAECVAPSAETVLTILRKAYPCPGPFITWSNPLELVVGTVLSAQCTDERVNRVTAVLFARYKTAEDYAQAQLVDLEKIIFSVGFYRSKARYLKGIGETLLARWGGEVPKTLDELLLLPGVSYKTAYIVLAKAWGIFVGVAVDTHVARLAPRIGLTTKTDPLKIGKDLAKALPKEDYLAINEYLITHGRAVCHPQKPACRQCVLQQVCKKYGVKE